GTGERASGTRARFRERTPEGARRQEERAMDNKQPRRTARLAAVAFVAITAADVGCVQEKVDMKARELAHIQKDLEHAQEGVKTGVQEQAERAKQGVAKLHEKLPELKQGAREGLEHAKE